MPPADSIKCLVVSIILASHTIQLAAADGANTAVTGRTTIPFQYAWRFHYGDDPSSPPGSGPGTAIFEKDLSNYSVCDGMEHAPNRFSLKDCRLACSYDPNCLVWQAFPIEHGRSCYQGYVGMNITCHQPDPEARPTYMGGGMRARPPTPAFRTDYSFAVADASSNVDEDWAIIDAPHDFIAEYGNFTEDQSDQHHGYLPRNASWYRKHFFLPGSWQKDGGATFVHFEGVFHHATFFLNGKYLMSHECGYTGFDVRLDNATGIKYGPEAENVLTLRADASFGSGHWYEGGGIYRPVHLEHVASTHITRDGLFVPPEGDGSTIDVSAELESTTARGQSVVVKFSLSELGSSTTIAVATSAKVAVPNRGTTVAKARVSPSSGSIKQWSTKSPNLYTVLAEVLIGDQVIDSVRATVGFRSTTFTGTDGHSPFTLNDEPMHFRGFSHHNSIGGLGVAIPERIQLFRVQASRALGSNIWRMSHNPYDTALYELLDATGQMCWDENRDYGAKYGGGVYAIAMHDMVKRDRNHPSVIMWSFCNEAECSQYDSDFSGLAFRAAAKGVDPTRPVTANGALSQTPTAQLDIQGGSHWSNTTFVKSHANNSTMPQVLSECCSCTSQREDRDVDAGCIGKQNSPGLISYVTGSLGVWTLMDYFGEPAGQPLHAWPHVSCDFGNFDIAGYPKSHAYWYSVNWLQRFGSKEPGRPALPYRTVARILNLPSSSTTSADKISAMTSAPLAELLLDGVSQGVLPTVQNARGEMQPTTWSALLGTNCTGSKSFPVNATGVQCHNLRRSPSGDNSDSRCAMACCADTTCDTWQLNIDESGACWTGQAAEGVGKCGLPHKGDWIGGQRAVPSPSPEPAFNNATLLALDEHHNVVAKHSLFTPSIDETGYKLQLTLDVPSSTTGTGNTLLLDGRDTAMVRCAVIDSTANDALVSSNSYRVTFTVKSGPGRAAGISNGNRSSHEWMKSNSVDTYLGLARGLFKVSQDCTSTSRASCAHIDADGESGPTLVKVSGCDTSPIVVQASSPGMTPVTISIPVSTDVAKDAAITAARSTSSNFADGFSYLDDFIG